MINFQDLSPYWFLNSAFGLVQKSSKDLGLENLFTPASFSIIYYRAIGGKLLPNAANVTSLGWSKADWSLRFRRCCQFWRTGAVFSSRCVYCYTEFEYCLFDNNITFYVFEDRKSIYISGIHTLVVSEIMKNDQLQQFSSGIQLIQLYQYKHEYHRQISPVSVQPGLTFFCHFWLSKGAW